MMGFALLSPSYAFLRVPQSVIANVNRVVSGKPQLLRKDRRQRVVDEKSHGAVSGSARLRKASAA